MTKKLTSSRTIVLNDGNVKKSRLTRDAEGNLAFQPELPPLTLCGGLQSVWYPQLTDAELEEILKDPRSLPAERDRAAAELTSRQHGDK